MLLDLVRRCTAAQAYMEDDAGVRGE